MEQSPPPVPARPHLGKPEHISSDEEESGSDFGEIENLFEPEGVLVVTAEEFEEGQQLSENVFSSEDYQVLLDIPNVTSHLINSKTRKKTCLTDTGARILILYKPPSPDLIFTTSTLQSPSIRSAPPSPLQPLTPPPVPNRPHLPSPNSTSSIIPSVMEKWLYLWIPGVLTYPLNKNITVLTFDYYNYVLPMKLDRTLSFTLPKNTEQKILEKFRCLIEYNSNTVEKSVSKIIDQIQIKTKLVTDIIGKTTKGIDQGIKSSKNWIEDHTNQVSTQQSEEDLKKKHDVIIKAKTVSDKVHVRSKLVLSQLEGASKILGDSVDKNVRSGADSAKTGVMWAKLAKKRSELGYVKAKSLPVLGYKLKDREREKRYEQFKKSKKLLEKGETSKIKKIYRIGKFQVPRIEQSKLFAKTLVQSFNDCSTALEESVEIILDTSQEAVVELATYRYGEPGGDIVNDVIELGKDVLDTAETVGEISSWIMDPKTMLIQKTAIESVKRGFDIKKQDDFVVPVKEGYLAKEIHFAKGTWKLRYVQIKKRTVRWYKRKPLDYLGAGADHKGGAGFKSLKLDSLKVADEESSNVEGNPWVFSIEQNKKTLADTRVHRFAASSREERKEWMDVLKREIELYWERKAIKKQKRENQDLIPLTIMDKKTLQRVAGIKDAVVDTASDVKNLM